MEKRLERLESKLDIVADKLISIDKTLVANTVILEEHQRRSLANERAVEILETQVTPIAKHVHTISVIGKIALTLLGSSLAAYIAQKINLFN